MITANSKVFENFSNSLFASVHKRLKDFVEEKFDWAPNRKMKIFSFNFSRLDDLAQANRETSNQLFQILEDWNKVLS